MSRGRRFLLLVAACTLPLPVQGTAPADALGDAAELFQAGDLAGARAKWIESLASRPSAAAYYNLGRVDQELAAGPQAVLWYRRALARAPEDPWAIENLERLRKDLGLPQPNHRGLWSLLHATLSRSTWVVAAVLWLTLAARWRTGRPRGWVLAATAGVLVAGYLGLQVGVRLAPREAVLMSECLADEGSLPAGSEVRAALDSPGLVWAASRRFDCPPDSVIHIDSNQLPPSPASLDSPTSEPVPLDPVADLEGTIPDLDPVATS